MRLRYCIEASSVDKKIADNSLFDVCQQLDDVISGDFAAVLPVERRKLAIHVQAALSIFEHLPATNNTTQIYSVERYKQNTYCVTYVYDICAASLT